MSPPPISVLVIGYGNALRSDDGVGVAIVARLSRHFYRNTRCMFETMHQLTPEVVAEISRAERVIFIDASVEARPGKVTVRKVKPDARRVALGHHLSPEVLLTMVQGMYERTPRAWVIGVGAANLGLGDRLSGPVRRVAERLNGRLRHLITRWSAACARCGVT